MQRFGKKLLCLQSSIPTQGPLDVLERNPYYIYRRLSLSQSPGDQTKYFELSVVWDNQFATSFTLYMYTDCLDHRDYNLHVHVFGNSVLEFKYPLTELLISDTNFKKDVTEIKDCWWLFTSKNVVKQCSITKVTKATLSLGIIGRTWLCDCVDY